MEAEPFKYLAFKFIAINRALIVFRGDNNVKAAKFKAIRLYFNREEKASFGFYRSAAEGLDGKLKFFSQHRKKNG